MLLLSPSDDKMKLSDTELTENTHLVLVTRIHAKSCFPELASRIPKSLASLTAATGTSFQIDRRDNELIIVSM